MTQIQSLKDDLRFSNYDCLRSRNRYFFFAAVFFAAAFFGAGDLAVAVLRVDFLAGAAAVAVFSALGFAGCFSFAESALKLCPPTLISVIWTWVKGWRCPCSFLYCFLRL